MISISRPYHSYIVKRVAEIRFTKKGFELNSKHTTPCRTFAVLMPFMESTVLTRYLFDTPRKLRWVSDLPF